ncbi:MAG TPA: FmdB family zinc ribbon protein [Jiangellaceae bacterium]
MPTYQYACTDCGEQLEVVQSFSDDALTECPVCGGRLRKVFSAVGVVFKGSGFYRNDSRSGSNGSGSSTPSTTTSSDSKPAAASSGSGSSGSGSGSGSSSDSSSATKKPASTPAA